ncbi:MAG TPA: hypothetical protein VF705_06415 [Longimicrobium sp.]|jgi:hypothetical protein
MTDREKRNAIRAYFNPFPKWALGLVAFGVLCILTGGGGAILGGLLFAGVGGAVLYLHTQRISDAEFDRLREEDLRKTVKNAIQKWGVDKDDIVSGPLHLYGPAFGATSTYATRKGGDGIIRFNPLRFAVIGFCEHQLLAYRGIIDMVTGNLLSEEASEYFYRDVVAAVVKTDSVEFTHRGVVHQLSDTETFALTTSGGTSIAVPIRSARLATLLGGEMPNTHAEAAIAAVRSMLRQKKSGIPV